MQWAPTWADQADGSDPDAQRQELDADLVPPLGRSSARSWPPWRATGSAAASPTRCCAWRRSASMLCSIRATRRLWRGLLFDRCFSPAVARPRSMAGCRFICPSCFTPASAAPARALASISAASWPPSARCRPATCSPPDPHRLAHLHGRLSFCLLRNESDLHRRRGHHLATPETRGRPLPD